MFMPKTYSFCHGSLPDPPLLWQLSLRCLLLRRMSGDPTDLILAGVASRDWLFSSPLGCSWWRASSWARWCRRPSRHRRCTRLHGAEVVGCAALGARHAPPAGTPSSRITIRINHHVRWAQARAVGQGGGHQRGVAIDRSIEVFLIHGAANKAWILFSEGSR